MGKVVVQLTDSPIRQFYFKNVDFIHYKRIASHVTCGQAGLLLLYHKSKYILAKLQTVFVVAGGPGTSDPCGRTPTDNADDIVVVLPSSGC